MAEQTIIQVRVDTQLKEQVTEVFDKIGIDIPTAVRMFFKAAVREQKLPFSTSVAPETPSEADKLMQYFKGMVMYDAPIADDDAVVVLPLENGRDIPTAMYVQLVSKVPAGRISCWEDIFSFLGKLYGRGVTRLPDRSLPQMDVEGNSIAFWRLVSNKGILGGGRWGNREAQKDQLIAEGIPVVQRGSIEGSYKVENYKAYMFNFNSLRVMKGV